MKEKIKLSLRKIRKSIIDYITTNRLFSLFLIVYLIDLILSIVCYIDSPISI